MHLRNCKSIFVLAACFAAASSVYIIANDKQHGRVKHDSEFSSTVDSPEVAEARLDLTGALYDAAKNGQTSSVLTLLRRGAAVHADEDAALQIAALNGHTETVLALLDAGAAIHAGNELYEQRDGALSGAALTGHTQTVLALLDRGADIHAGDDAALHMAAIYDHRDITSLLRVRGAKTSPQPR